jgi:hypothetical protein
MAGANIGAAMATERAMNKELGRDELPVFEIRAAQFSAGFLKALCMELEAWIHLKSFGYLDKVCEGQVTSHHSPTTTDHIFHLRPSRMEVACAKMAQSSLAWERCWTQSGPVSGCTVPSSN